MNKIFNKLTGGANGHVTGERKATASGQTFDRLNEQLQPLGLHIEAVTGYTLGVYKGGDVVGYYPNITEIKAAIKNGTITESNK